MNRRKNIIHALDWKTIAIYITLVCIGWFCIYSSVYDAEHASIFDTSQRYGMQMIWIGTAFLIAIFVLCMDIKVFTILSIPSYLIILLLLIFVMFAGREVNGSKSWLAIGAIRIQPVEFMKIATSLMVAYVISEYGFKINSFTNIIKLLVIFIVPIGLILMQKDTGSALVFSSFLIMLYREGMSGWIIIGIIYLALLFVVSLLMPTLETVCILTALTLLIYIILSYDMLWKSIKIAFTFFIGLILAIFIRNEADIKLETPYLILIYFAIVFSILLIKYNKGRLSRLLFVVIFFFASVFLSFSVDYVFNNVLKPHQRNRIEDMLNMKVDLQGTGYNVNQSKIAIGSGGMLGQGFLQGTQTKFNFVPEQSTDFIFCTIGEETGFAGCLALIVLYFILLWRIIVIAERQRFAFTRIFAYCTFGILFFHFAVNISMTIGLIPVIGIPLPFLSYGGSSLWAFTIMLFILLKLDTKR
ncbi:MAG: rod shape-determining protein RodA [Prevotellaceae bacterium]|jgi:rod shape determining protein RodA|nr:rod shape-determining protein RodA [Prevotellaceae bacterium]